MTRTAISISQLAAGGSRNILRTSPATAFDQANGHSIASAFGSLPLSEQLFLEFVNSDTAAHVITVRAGSSTYGAATALGDYTQSVPAGADRLIGPINLARHAQDANATIYVDGDSGTTGTITATLRAAQTDPRTDTYGLAAV